MLHPPLGGCHHAMLLHKKTKKNKKKQKQYPYTLPMWTIIKGSGKTGNDGNGYGNTSVQRQSLRTLDCTMVWIVEWARGKKARSRVAFTGPVRLSYALAAGNACSSARMRTSPSFQGFQYTCYFCTVGRRYSVDTVQRMDRLRKIHALVPCVSLVPRHFHSWYVDVWEWD